MRLARIFSGLFILDADDGLKSHSANERDHNEYNSPDQKQRNAGYEPDKQVYKTIADVFDIFLESFLDPGTDAVRCGRCKYSYFMDRITVL